MSGTIPLGIDYGNFNLHYFDWARQYLEECLNKDDCDNKLFLISELIDQWIENNPVGSEDGWHSYTISLRIRNWIWFFSSFPNSATQEESILFGSK